MNVKMIKNRQRNKKLYIGRKTLAVLTILLMFGAAFYLKDNALANTAKAENEESSKGSEEFENVTKEEIINSGKIYDGIYLDEVDVSGLGYDDAIKEYEKAIRFDPNYDIAYNNLGVIYLDDLGRVQKAIELFEEAARCNPNYALAHYNLARAIAITGNKIEAAKLYQIALDLNSYSHELDQSEIEEKIQGLFD